MPRRKYDTSGTDDTPDAAVQEPLMLDGEDVAANIQKLLKYSTFAPEQRYWLDTGSPELNAVFGSRTLGIPYGKIIELAGEEHAGKTALATVLAGMAQREGAGVGRIDLEDSRDAEWESRLGLNSKGVVSIWTKLIQRKKTEAPQLQSAEELFAEMETGIKLLGTKYGLKKQFWFVDSIANVQTEMAQAAGTDQNMRTNVDRAMFLSGELPRLAGLCANYNVLVFLLNQLREKPGLVFGDPIYTPGGRGLRHACSIRARIRRCGNGKILHGPTTIGLMAIVKNIKNKAGGNSVQGAEAGIRIKWNRNPARYEFMSREEAEGRMKA